MTRRDPEVDVLRHFDNHPEPQAFLLGFTGPIRGVRPFGCELPGEIHIDGLDAGLQPASAFHDLDCERIAQRSVPGVNRGCRDPG